MITRTDRFVNWLGRFVAPSRTRERQMLDDTAEEVTTLLERVPVSEQTTALMALERTVRTAYRPETRRSGR